MKAKKNIESKAAGTILERPETVKVGGRTYSVAPPSLATLVMLSEAISDIPSEAPEKDEILRGSLAMAAECKPLGHAAAILVMGARAVRKDASFPSLGRRLRRLERQIMESMTPAEVRAMVVSILQGMEVGDFFALTTFLGGINLLRPTRGVEKTGATASGPR